MPQYFFANTFKVLEWKNNVECVVGMFQKEVAQGVAAKEGNKVGDQCTRAGFLQCGVSV